MRTVLVHIRSDLPLWSLPAGLAERWRARFGRLLRLLVADSADEFERALPEAEGLIGGGLGRDNFALAERLAWVQSGSAGVGHLLFPELVRSNVVLTNARGVYAAPMAEHLLALLLALVRKLHRARDLQREGRWGQETLWREEPPPDEVGGRTLGVVGLGAVGTELAWRARSLGMRVIALRRRAELGGVVGVDEVRGEQELPWLLAESDFVANCLPETARTRGLFGAAAFARMRPGSLFLNVGRGGTVDETALAAALEGGRVAAAGIDVTAEEPPSGESPLWRLPQVLLTPHVSGSSRRFWERAAVLFEDNLGRFLEGRPLVNVVDKQEGY